jgi:hypothetical protein
VVRSSHATGVDGEAHGVHAEGASARECVQDVEGLDPEVLRSGDGAVAQRGTGRRAVGERFAAASSSTASDLYGI